MGEKVEGTLVIIGGAEDKSGEQAILKRFAELVRRNPRENGDGALVILTTAASSGKKSGELYRTVFDSLGLRGPVVLDVGSRPEAEDSGNAGVIERARGIFMTGGDQLRITSILGGTRVGGALRNAYENGAIIGGTSAGASAMSDIMIVGGAGDDSPSRGVVSMAPGLGLLEEAVIDQHFAQRGRIGRLLSAVAQNPYVLGIGLDEDTAIIVNPDATFEVVGSNTAVVVDGSGIDYSNVSESEAGQALCICGVVIHVLCHGYRFDMKRRSPILYT